LTLDSRTGSDIPAPTPRWQRPGGPAAAAILAVKIDQVAVDRALETLVDGPLDSPIAFDAALPLTAGAAQDWGAATADGAASARLPGQPDTATRWCGNPLAERPDSRLAGWWPTTPIANFSRPRLRDRADRRRFRDAMDLIEARTATCR